MECLGAGCGAIPDPSVRSRHVNATLITAVLMIASVGTATAPSTNGCTQGSDAVAGVIRHLIESDNARDLSSVLAAYADDITFLPPTGEVATGKQSVEDRYRALFAAFRPHLETTIDEVRVEGTLAYVRGVNGGSLEPVAGGAATVVHDRYLAILECRNGRWVISRLMWNKVAAP